MGGQPAGVVDLAPGNDESHGAGIYLLGHVAGPPRSRVMMRGMTSTPAESPRDFGTIGVIGLGTMGAGIAEVFARNGYSVVGVELNDDGVERGRQHLEHSTGRAVKREKMTAEEQQELLGRISLTTSIKDLGEADFVVEAVVESLEVKKDIFRQLDDIVAPESILATNTSSLSVTEISTANSRPGRVIGVHFFNPAPVQNLVEIVRTVVTEPQVLDDVKALVHQIGKNPVVCGDKAGFIANTLLFGYLNHAVSMYEHRYATREDIDAAMRFGCGYPMGPLALLDLIGLDTAYEILETMYRQGRDRLHAPAPILKQMVTAGMLGRKTGRGFYTYEGPDSPIVVADDITPSADEKPRLRHDIKQVGVVGTGTMATGIVEVFAKAGYDVLYVGRSQAKVDGVRDTIERSLDKAIQRGKLEESAKAEVLGRLTGSTSLDDLGTADIVVEAIAEDLKIKTTLFENLDEICKPGAILATTTSSLPIIECAQATKRPQDVVGMHFFNPAPIMKLVEVVSTVTTADEVTETTRALCAQVGKVAVSCGDRAGFIVNALLFPYLNDAVKMLEAHYASADDIDVAMKQGCALPMGPFELLDVVGNDVSLAIQRELYLEFREPGFAPAPLLEHLVTAGYLGRKTKRGFRDYSTR
jgi:3-hydroxybutyryl-CoA dehydrogenase